MFNITNHQIRWIKTIMKYHLTPVRVAVVKKAKDRCWWGCRETEMLKHCWWECNMVQLLWKTLWSFLKKLKMIQQSHFWAFNPKGVKSESWRDICASMFIVTLFKNSQNVEKQKKYSPIDEWIKDNVVYTHSAILFSLKKEENSICLNLDELKRHCSEWNKPVAEGQILHVNT